MSVNNSDVEMEQEEIFSDNENLTPRQQLKTILRGYYDIQKLRISTGNRVVAVFKDKLGVEPGKKEDEGDLGKVSKIIFEKIKEDYIRFTDGVILMSAKFSKKYVRSSTLIHNRVELALVSQYLNLLQAEETAVYTIKEYLETFKIYTNYLADIPGCGPLMSAVLISYLDIEKAKYPSSFVKYAGLDVAPDGRGRGKYKDHLVEREYIDKDGKVNTKLGITYSPFLHTKLLAVLGSAFIKARSPYAEIFYETRHREEMKNESRPENKKLSAAHIYKRSIRRMMRIFLQDLHVKWRQLEGLPVSKPYEVEKLGLSEHVRVMDRTHFPFLEARKKEKEDKKKG
jgi:hypothetical protein